MLTTTDKTMERMIVSRWLVAVAMALPSLATAQKPVHLMTDLIEHTDRVFIGGRPSTLTLGEVGSAIEPWQVAEVRTPRPRLTWAYSSPEPGACVVACEVTVGTSPDLGGRQPGVVWTSGRRVGRGAWAMDYGGPDLKPSTTYYWRVRTWDSNGREATSAVKAFRTADSLDGQPSRYPLTLTDEEPAAVRSITPGMLMADFADDAFGQLSLTVTARAEGDTLTIHLGEQQLEGRVNRKPEGSQRYARYVLPLLRGTHTYRVKLRKDRRNTTPRRNESRVDPILMPAYIGEVFPFRYCEVEGIGGDVEVKALVRHVASYPFDAFASSFESSDSVLNRVWQLCKHTVRATSFCGTYVDGDRERIPYEADAIINQLSHYAVDREYSIARHSVRHLIYNPTWPTEWILQSVIMAWNDYMYTGDSRLLASAYTDLQAKTLLALREGNGLISTRTGKATREVYESIHFKGERIKDIVDWPQTGAAGVEKEDGGEADGFVFTDYNAVVNAYHYEALVLMAKMAGVLGKDSDARSYEAEAERVAGAFSALLRDKADGLFRDGVGTDHKSLHSNMFALDFGLVADGDRKGVVDFIKSRRMGCSVYGAQFLLDALYDAGEAGYALSLLTSTARRSWYNMLRIGSTITTEAWDNVYKPNQDWNHPWGAAPANVIVRKLMGVEPLEPGFGRFRIKPQPASLKRASITVPTIRGDVAVAFENEPGSSFSLHVGVPANTTAEVWVPRLGKRPTVDGRAVRARRSGVFWVVELSPGSHDIGVSAN